MTLARILHRLHNAAVALTRDHASALESLRTVNKDLLVTAFAEVPPSVAAKCDEARTAVLEAVRMLEPIPEGSATPFEELPPAEHRDLVIKDSAKSQALTKPVGQN